MTDVDHAREEEAKSVHSGPETGPFDDVSLTEFKAFIGDDEYAQDLYAHLQSSGRFAGFNIWAAFFGCGWFAYRKLYWQGVGVLAFENVLMSVIGTIPLILLGTMEGLHLSVSVITITFVAVRVGVGFWGNTALTGKAVKTIQEVDALNLDNEAHVQMIAACGRVSVGAFFIALGIVGVINRLVYLPY